MSYIELNNIRVEFGEEKRFFSFKRDAAKVVAVNDITMRVEKGDFLAIMGKSGCGKTTLLNVIGTLLRPQSGAYYLDEKNVIEMSDYNLSKVRNEEIGFIVQHFALVDDINVEKNVALPLTYKNMSGKEIDKRVADILERMSISDKAKKYPYELSGGQKQRVAIARALIAGPSLLLADEPTGSLDEETGKEIVGILKDLNQNSNMTIIMATHDRDIASEAKKIIHMRDGRIIQERDRKI